MVSSSNVLLNKANMLSAQKAKEAEAAKKKGGGGWGLGGWFSKKEPDMGAQPNKPIKAKLGEESSFVYDPELKRWINKKAGAENTEAKSASAPPPPRAGPPRTASGPPAPGPTSIPRMPPPAQRAVSEAGAPLMSSMSDSGLAPPGMSRSVSNGSSIGGSGPPTAPPSRPGTGMSNSSSIDDLLGPPTARKGGARTKKKGRGYVDVMGEK